MTNKEAIEVLDTLEISIGAKELREFGFKLTSNRLANLADAVQLAKQALREKADKDRRYVVHSYETMGKVYWCVYDKYQHRSVASEIATREAAQSIADIYEGVKS